MLTVLKSDLPAQPRGPVGPVGVGGVHIWHHTIVCVAVAIAGGPEAAILREYGIPSCNRHAAHRRVFSRPFLVSCWAVDAVIEMGKSEPGGGARK